MKTKEIKLEPLNIDKIAIMKDNYFPDAYIIDLPLDSKPDHVWQHLFECEWKSSRQLWDRKLFVMGDKFRLVTSANNVKEKLDWVKQVIGQTNRDVKEHNRSAKIRAVELSKKAMEEERTTIERIRNGLRRFRPF